MKKKILLMIPFLPMVSFGQHIENQFPKSNPNNFEIVKSFSSLKQKELSIKTKVEIKQEVPLNEMEYQKNPEILLEDKIPNTIKTNYVIKKDTYKDINLNVDGIVFGSNYSCSQIIESYDLINENNLKFEYNNTYLVIKDSNDNIVGTESHIERNVGFLKQTFDIKTANLKPSISLICYPNPAKKHINLKYELEASGNYKLEVLNINGQALETIFDYKILEKGIYTNAINLDLPEGNYIITLQSNKEKISQKITLKN
jgi:hypothetical protein